MDVLSNVPLAFFQGFLLFLIAKIILDISYTKRDYLAILVVIIPSAFLFIYLGSISILYLLIGCGLILYTKVKLYSLIAVLSSAILMFFGNFLGFLFVVLVENHTQNYVIISFSYIVIFFAISLVLAFSVQILLKKLMQSYLSINKTYLTIISLVLVLSFIILYVYSQIPNINNSSLKMYGLIFIGIILFFTVLIIFISNYMIKELRYKRNMEEIETYYEYTLQIESINNEMRKFRHDYVNILTTMSEYIREDDMPGLRQYFNENIVPMKDNLQMKSIKINGTENLKVRAIKGLVTTKILQAQEKNIPISIEVPELVEHIEMNTIDLSRIIGIITDNAIEASETLEDALIRIAFINTDSSVMFIVMNKCKEDMPRIHELFQERFSTKGENRGLGLSTLKEITDSTENVLLDTTIENGYFIQKVEIINN
ncbi:quorum-sensing sensor histidine kinase AgrC [Staphylococcus haemolyticus]|uniref:quorum-sensing sensor histidine kinase AgrC n=1 Tax=Staphylococcus TaxID=1279 RepID=UPI00069D084F|nr:MULTISPECIES: GHKL domain-containing protein [Staphylococcus]KAA2274603.1 GHKL domain-containing protein [Staphylococcus sp. GDX7P312P]KAA2278823.1 GHKL domain-containing protein [Staphylococcus sp. GDX7P459A]MCE4955063.1 GHKL domain-containing protein [Staphylococcus haemolyticus]MCE4964163.1 GHKL domain-containing protein [Staphylococcus haemolyticus]MCE4988056.1 GHKL domain-containing protein [Staphylococcus haemolyticus]